MNMVRELRIKKGIQAKQLALEIGVSNATVSDWEHGRKNPTGIRLKKLAEYFGVDEGFVLGYGVENPNLFVPENPEISGKSETEQIVQYVLDKLSASQPIVSYTPKTDEARLVSGAMDRMSQQDREKALNLLKTVYAEYFDTDEEKQA